jgi:DnaJ-class molecular chaperone
MKLNVFKAIIQNSMKIVPLIIVMILLNSCNSKRENLKNRVIMNYISSLEEAVDSLNQNVDSLNYRLLKLEEGAKNQDLVTEMNSEGPKVDRKIVCPNCNGVSSIKETCNKCRGSGKYGEWHIGPHNRSFQYDCVNCKGKGWITEECPGCYGRGRINEYE